MAIFNACLLFIPSSLRYCYAEDAVTSNEDSLTWIFNNPFFYSKASYTSSNPYVRVRVGTSSTNSLVTSVTYYAFNYKVADVNGSYANTLWNTCVFGYSDTTFSSNEGVRIDYSGDKLNFTNLLGGSYPNTRYVAQVENSRTIYYMTVQESNYQNNIGRYLGINMPDDCPRIFLKYGQDVKSVLYLFSSGDFSYIPWNFSTTSGGMHFDNDTDLSPENTSKYSQIFIVMDTNNDNSVTEEEVNFYNYTYHTNYDYSQINEGNNFTELEFLEWISLQIANGDDNPGGGTGSGGSSDNIGGGITVGDGSFTQSQTQTQSIAENAVNVTVNNDNSLNQDNTQWLNSVINNNLGNPDSVNAFENAIGSIGGFTSVAHSFASLASAVLSFLPAWVTTLLSLMFVILFVFIVFRLIHLFI